ncbi:hypothetical protein GWC77_27560, partial [Paraburkholderia sp. NMBU_R16]|nr:hypothetical protein [Paraburkholderia sp. NMBU_R16]
MAGTAAWRWCTDRQTKDESNRIAVRPAGSPCMPHKHNAARRHDIPKMAHRVTNWPEYEAG